MEMRRPCKHHASAHIAAVLQVGGVFVMDLQRSVEHGLRLGVLVLPLSPIGCPRLAQLLHGIKQVLGVVAILRACAHVDCMMQAVTAMPYLACREGPRRPL